MLFTSIGFLAIYLPAFLVSYFAVPQGGRNVVLLIFSLAFYWIGAGGFTLWLVALIVGVYFMGNFVHATTGLTKQIAAALAVTGSLLLLFVFKYANFAGTSLNTLLSFTGGLRVPVPENVLPLGISFFTFQAIAYIIDIYRGRHLPARSLVEFAVFKAAFPQLVAGPIVRFQQVEDDLRRRRETIDGFLWGLTRFACGLFRKLVYADSLGSVSDAIFAMDASSRSASLAWLGIICYTFQIYHDFAGYSDMAIGLGRLLGFNYPENFEQPYRATSVTEFWRHWHQSLSFWFRDYLYIPLGGNRVSRTRMYFNLTLVFVLCGMWHGASWTFVVWGLFHGFLLVAERFVIKVFGWEIGGLGGWAYTLISVGLGWVIFRCPSLSAAWQYFASLLPRSGVQSAFSPSFYLTLDHIIILFASAACAFVPIDWFRGMVTRGSGRAAAMVAAFAAYLYALAVLAANGFNPFIYFRF